MDAFEKKWYTFSEINRKSTASTTAWATRTFLRNIQVWVIIWIITTANLWCHWFGLLSRYWFGVRLLPNSVFDSCTIYVEDGGVTAIKACLSEVQYPATEKGSATSIIQAFDNSTSNEELCKAFRIWNVFWRADIHKFSPDSDSVSILSRILEFQR